MVPPRVPPSGQLPARPRTLLAGPVAVPPCPPAVCLWLEPPLGQPRHLWTPRVQVFQVLASCPGLEAFLTVLLSQSVRSSKYSFLSGMKLFT